MLVEIACDEWQAKVQQSSVRPLVLLEAVREVRIKEGSSWHNHIRAGGPLPAQPCASSLRRHHHGSPHSGLGVKSPSFSNWTSVQQVKQIMEEAVTRKFVHEDSSHIVSFCGESLVVGFTVTWGCSTLTRGLLPRGPAVLCVLPGMSPLGRWLVPEGELFWQQSGSLRSSLCAQNRSTRVRRMLAVHTVT